MFGDYGDDAPDRDGERDRADAGDDDRGNSIPAYGLPPQPGDEPFFDAGTDAGSDADDAGADAGPLGDGGTGG